MSWFNTESIKKHLNADALSGWTDKILSKETFEKLTLTTPELTAERQRMDQEELRKERVRDMLAGLFPWETRDPERDILVEECKEAILKLSESKANFYGPYPMPNNNLMLDLEDEESHNDSKEGEEAVDLKQPSKESLEKMKTLEPLPPLLQHFDLNNHVGLIQKVLIADPKLVKLQASLGCGEHEMSFWRNYFFHCAWCRYEAGLSIDEIWSEQEPKDPKAPAEEETIEFEPKEELSSHSRAVAADPVTDADAPLRKDVSPTSKETPASVASTGKVSPSVSVDYDILDGNDVSETDVLVGDEPVDYELDELEAEIARELEDM
jgi:hypothetical protein